MGSTRMLVAACVACALAATGDAAAKSPHGQSRGSRISISATFRLRAGTLDVRGQLGGGAAKHSLAVRWFVLERRARVKRAVRWRVVLRRRAGAGTHFDFRWRPPSGPRSVVVRVLALSARGKRIAHSGSHTISLKQRAVGPPTVSPSPPAFVPGGAQPPPVDPGPCPPGQSGTPPDCVTLSPTDPDRGPTLAAGQILEPGQYLRSTDSHYRLVMQGDGNLVEYVAGRALWSSGTVGHPGASLYMQGTDGNLVIYDAAKNALWQAKTGGNPGDRLALQVDANLVVYSGENKALWTNNQTNNSLRAGEQLRPGWYLQSSDRKYRLVMQGDGNLVEYKGGSALWSSGTVGHPGAAVELQDSDGNLVIYDTAGMALWQAKTAGNPGDRLQLQTDGNLVVYAASGQVLWSRPAQSGSTAAERAAVAWARPYADVHNTSYNGLCLTFVFDAYSAASLNLRNWVNVPIGADTYPVDIWGHFTHGSTGSGTPPLGALVFWKATNGDRTLSHVALSLGGGNLVSTSDGVTDYTHYETTAQHSYAIYQGWWLPDQ